MIFVLIGEVFDLLPDGRKDKNTTYEVTDAAAGAFGVFFTQSPSFLRHQQYMERSKGQNNAASLFGVRKILSDQQIRNILDVIPPHDLYEPFWVLHKRMEQAEHLSEHKGHDGTYLVALDGTYYFSSQSIHCENCTVHQREDQVHYFHSAGDVIANDKFPENAKINIPTFAGAVPYQQTGLVGRTADREDA